MVVPLFYDIFRVKPSIFKLKNKSAYRLEFGNMAIHSFLSLFCPVGRKVNRLKIPRIIQTNKILLRWYLSGLFDTDGSITKDINSPNLCFSFVQASKDFVFEVGDALKYIGAPVPGPTIMKSSHPDDRSKVIIEWRIEAHSRKRLKLLLNQIEFLHPEKRILAEKIYEKIGGSEEN